MKLLTYHIILSLLITVFTYAAMSKLLNYTLAKNQMVSQLFPYQVALILTWLIPVIELLVSILLIFRRTQTLGLYCALALLVSFTIYILTALFGRFSSKPCSCGGIISEFSFVQHLIFNLILILLNIALLIISPNYKKLE